MAIKTMFAVPVMLLRMLPFMLPSNIVKGAVWLSGFRVKFVCLKFVSTLLSCATTCVQHDVPFTMGKAC